MNFFANEFTPPPKHPISLMSWHPIHSIVAVSFGSATGHDNSGKKGKDSAEVDRVIFYTKEGTLVENVSIAKKKKDLVVTAMKWHPRIYMLAIGWNDGTLSVWNHSDELLREDFHAHSGKQINSVEWSPTPSIHFIASGDAEGVVALWKVDERRRLNPIFQLTAASTSCDVVFVNRVDEEVGALCFGSAGEIRYVDIDGSASEIFQIDAATQEGSEGGEEGMNTKDMAIRSYFVSEPTSSTDESGLVTFTYHIVLLTSDFCCYELEMARSTKSAGDKKATVTYKQAMDSVICSGNLENDEQKISSILCDSSLLLIVNCEPFIRAWNISLQAHYLISPPPISQGRSGKIVTGTKSGGLFLYEFVGEGYRSSKSQDDWILLYEIRTAGFVRELCYGMYEGGEGVLVKHGDTASTLFEAPGMCGMDGSYALLQLEKNAFLIRKWKGGFIGFDTPLSTVGVDIRYPHIMHWDRIRLSISRFAEDIDSDSVRKLGIPTWEGPLSCNMAKLIGKNQFVVARDEYTLGVHESVGKEIQVTHLGEENGELTHMFTGQETFYAIQGSRLLTSYKVEPTGLKVTGTSKVLTNGLEEALVDTISVNCSSNCFAFTTPYSKANVSEEKATIHFFSTEKDTLFSHELSENSLKIVSHRWDREDERLICILVDNLPHHAREKRIKYTFHLLFVDEKQCAAYPFQEMEAPAKFCSFLSLDVPRIFYASCSTLTTPKTLDSILIKDFEHIYEEEDESSINEDMKRTFLDFFFDISANKMEEALRKVQNVENRSVWISLAIICIKRKRLALVRICLEKLEDAVGLMILHQNEKKDYNIQVTEIAIHFKLFELATSIISQYHLHKRQLKYLEGINEWEETTRYAKDEARIYLRSVYHRYAEYCLKQGRIFEALKYMTNSSADPYEVAGIIFKYYKQDEYIDVLERLTIGSDAKDDIKRVIMNKFEATNEMEKAMQLAESIKSDHAIVRILVGQGKLEEAKERALVNLEDKKSSYVVAQCCEANGDRDMIKFYRLAGQHLYAIKLAMKHGFNTELSTLTLLAPPCIVTQLSEYFKSNGMSSNAVQVSLRGNRLEEAVDICIRDSLSEEMDMITDVFSAQNGISLINKWANYLISKDNGFEAVELLAKCQHFEKATQVAEELDIALTNDLTLKLTPPDDHPSRNAILASLAALCRRQSHFVTAANYYAKIAEYVLAAESLIEGGDTETLVNFAKSSRNREVYKMVAEYLQQKDWIEEPWIMQTIILFYSKSKSYGNLATFFEGCAEMEISEYNNYKKALNAYAEALKWAKKIRGDDGNRAAEIQSTIKLISRKAKISSLTTANPEEGVKSCIALLDEKTDVGEAFLLSKICEGYCAMKRYADAYVYLKRLEQANNLNVISPKIVQAIYKNRSPV